MTATSDPIHGERTRRLRRFEEVGGEHGYTEALKPFEVNAEGAAGVRVFFGGRGIWYDSARTKQLAEPGVTVGVLHTGRHYPDDLAADCIEYHYPVTKVPGKDRVEVEATKNAMRLGLPVFVVVQRGSVPDVHLGWIEDASDVTQSFLIAFGDEPKRRREDTASGDAPFVALGTVPRKRAEITRREHDPRFRVRVRHRYGTACGACGLGVEALIDAAHVIPVASGGTSDPRNGLPLCPTHHRAFDRGLFFIDPDNLSIVATPGLALQELDIRKASIGWLPNTPHPDALRWRWEQMANH